ncbi:MAG: phosphatase PAP2 family protein [Thermoleophilia bacterium]|nr:phosphatase PAP2 family protein [Thermoleophilia bacterium]
MSVSPRPLPRLRAPRIAFPGWWPTLLQVLMCAGAALCYFGVRGLTQGAVAQAHGNAERLVELERALGISWEHALQGAVVASGALVTLANWVYIYGHWPVVVATLVVLYLKVPHRYYTLRNALFISGAIGLVIFALVPVAPPRLGVLDLVDTVTQRSSSYRAFQPPGLINRYAALPSLHFGWNLIAGVMIWQAWRHPAARTFAVLMPCAMGLAVVATANHYVVDVLAGALVALAGLALALLLPRVRATPAWARPPR